MSRPALTVLMPSYNYARFLRQAIESILSQSFEDFEFLIIEDGSTDESPEIIREYMRQDKRLRAVFHEKNGGMLERLNSGTPLAKGDYLHYIAADDFRYPGFLEKTMGLLKRVPTLEMVYTQFHYGREEDLLFENCGFESRSDPYIFTPDAICQSFLDKNFKVFSHTAVLKTDLIMKYHGFDPQLRYFSDWYLFNQIAFNHKFALLPEPLARFRIHDTNYSNIHRHNKKTRRQIYHHLLEKIEEPQNAVYREQIRKCGMLTFIFQDFFWKLLFNPKYLSFWPAINKKYPIKKRLSKSFRKKIGLKSRV